MLSTLQEQSAALVAIRITHGVGEILPSFADGAAMREEQNLDRNCQAGMQSEHHDEENAGGLRISS